MKACVLDQPGPIESAPLGWRAIADPTPGPGEALIRVRACGVCRTDLHEYLYGERALRSVANNTRQDGQGFLAEAARLPVRTHTEIFPLADANRALRALKDDAIRGAAVLKV